MERFGRTREEVFYGSLARQKVIGKKGIEEIPASGLGVYTYFLRIEQGLRQLMAGARKFKLSDDSARPDREDLVALTREAAHVSSIPFVTEHDCQIGDEIIKAAL